MRTALQIGQTLDSLPEFCSPGDLSKVLPVSRATMCRMAEQGRIPCIRLGRRIIFKRCVRQAGIPDANFHALRHTFATRSLEQGMDVVTLSRLLGHANPSITLDKCGHALNDHKKVSIDKLGELYSRKRKIPLDFFKGKTADFG